MLIHIYNTFYIFIGEEVQIISIDKVKKRPKPFNVLGYGMH